MDVTGNFAKFTFYDRAIIAPSQPRSGWRDRVLECKLCGYSAADSLLMQRDLPERLNF